MVNGCEMGVVWWRWRVECAQGVRVVVGGRRRGWGWGVNKFKV